MNDCFDVIVTGGGPAGMTAAMCAARLGLRTTVLEHMMPGNQIMNCENIVNIPGFPDGIHGADFGALLFEQAMNVGVEIQTATVSGLRVEGEDRIVVADDRELRAKAVILAHGSSLRTLGVPGEERLRGSGVSHCAACDGPLFPNKVVGVVGGGDSAVDEAITLTQFASEVVLFHRGETLTAQAMTQPTLLEHPKVTVRWNSVVEEVLGDRAMTGVVFRDLTTNERNTAELAGLFVFVGLDPNTSFLQDVLDLDPCGHINTNIQMETSIPGVFAAGDIRQGSVALIASGAGDGATAAVSAYRYISGHETEARVTTA